VYVNGELAQQASDQIELDVGDRVEWRWEEIQDELLDN
jgi:plastocyanin